MGMGLVSVSFKSQVEAIAKKTGITIDKVTRRTFFDMFARVVMRSPVDTGRFRANWQFSVGEVDRTTTGEVDPGPVTQDGSGPSTKKRAIEMALFGVNIARGDVLYLANSLDYAQYLEFGRANGRPGSQQAPFGMIRVTVGEFQAALDAAAREFGST